MITDKSKDTNSEAQPKEKSEYNLLVSKIAIKYTALICFTVLMVFLIIQLRISPVTVVIMNNKPIAIVPSKKDFVNVLYKLEQEREKVYNKDVKLDQEPSYKFAILPNKYISTPQQIKDAIEDNMNFLVKASAILVNGKPQVFLNNAKDAQKVLEDLKNKYCGKESGQKVEFCEDVKICSMYVLPEKIQKPQEAVQALTKTVYTTKEYVIKSGDTLWDIAEKNNIPVDKLCSINSINLDKIYPGQKIKLAIPNNIVNVKATKHIEYEEPIPYEVKYHSDSSIYKGQRKVVSIGKPGKKKVKATVVERNGVEVERIIVDEDIISQPQHEIIVVGTKVAALGKLAMFSTPVFGSVTSRFGFRQGGFHAGVDISGEIGDPICAADSGVVIFSGFNGGYGNLIIIDHKNGYKTYYAHNSKNLVSVGQRVSKGTKIATVGMTGNTTGPHLHFEVRKNGTPIDPLKFLKLK